MGSCLIKIKDLYFEWSTVVDAPITNGMKLRELVDYIEDEYGKQGLREFPERFARVIRYGHSMVQRYPSPLLLKGFIEGNRAGENETELTADQIYEKYQRRKNEKEQKK
jgi:hypothetical protein